MEKKLVNEYSPHSLEIRVRTSRTQMLAQVEQARLAGLVKAVEPLSKEHGRPRDIG